MVTLLRRIRDEMNAEWADLSWAERCRGMEQDLAADAVWQRWLRKDGAAQDDSARNGAKS